jgi:secondary thiamine-phosphate synthase enzyme
MKSYTEYMTMCTEKRIQLVHLTRQAEEVVKKSGIQEGMLLISAMHITAGVIINDNEPGFHKDLDNLLERLTPYGAHYNHNFTGEDNGAAHLRSILVGHEVIVPITNGKLDLGPWQRIFYAEFDGQRNKRLIFKAMGE